MDIQNININELEISKLNVRKNISNNEALDELKKSIVINGLLNPLTVKYNNESKKYEIIAGQRRFIVLKELDYKTVICNIISNDKNEDEQIIISLTENIHRSNMLLSERVKTINHLTNKFDGNCKKVAESTNISIRTIHLYNKISYFPDFIIDMLDAKGDEKLSLEFMVHLSKLKFITEIISENKVNPENDNSYSDLIKIIKVFQDVNNSDRLNIIKEIIKNNITETSFCKYIEKIGKIKTYYLEEKRREEETKQKIKDEIERREKEQERKEQKEKEEQVHKEKERKEHEKDKPGDTPIVEENFQKIIDDKILKIKQENNDSIYITTKTRNPGLQNLYRDFIIDRFNNCILSDMHHEVCEAAHIIPFSECENFDIDNGLLLNSILHKLFDKYYWSINPETLRVEILNFNMNTNGIYNILEPYKDKYIEILKSHDKTIKYLSDHYKKFKQK